MLTESEIQLELQSLFDQHEFTKLQYKVSTSKEIRKFIFNNTNHIQYLSNRGSQRLYHYLHKLNEIPKDSNGIMLGFKNIEVGYCAGPSYKLNYNKDCAEIILNSFKAKEAHFTKRLESHERVQRILINATPYLPNVVSMKTRFWYVHYNFTAPQYCKHCGKLLTVFTLPYMLNYCSISCQNALCFDDDSSMLTYLKMEYFKTDKKRQLFSLTYNIEHSIQLKSFVWEKTQSIFPVDFNNIQQRVYHIVYGIDNIPLCKKCGKSLINNFSVNMGAYATTCSRQCNNTYIENITNRLSNNGTNKDGYHTNIGKNEKIILDFISSHANIDIERNGRISKYFPDGIDLINKVIYEVNEPYHILSKQKFLYDLKKYIIYINAGYTIHIVWDNFPTQKYIALFRLKILIRKLKHHLYNSFHLNQTNNLKILSDTGAVDFFGVKRQLVSGAETISITTNDTNITTTPEHILYSNGSEVIASNITKTDKIDSSMGPVQILDIKKEKYDGYVYDVLNAGDNNRFFCNNILVHNCLIIDEAACVENKLMDQFIQAIYPVISSSKNSKFFMVSTPRGASGFFYETYENARLGVDKTGWKCMKIDWWDVPGRDEEWKNQQIASFNGDMKKFSREFGNCVHSSTKVFVKHQNAEEWQELTVRELWDRLQSDGEAYRDNSSNYFVYTPYGGKWFKGIRRVISDAFIEVEIEGLEPIKVTPKHRFMIGKNPVNATDLKCGDRISTLDGSLEPIKNIRHIYERDYAYDLTNVGEMSVYYTNKMVSHNCFEGSTYTLIPVDIIAKYKEFILSKKWFKPTKIEIEGGWQWNQWFKPEKGHCYLIGADCSDGVGKDYSIILVFDITYGRKIKQVASFSGQLSTIEFSYILAKIGNTYFNAPIAMEANGIGRGVLNMLLTVYEYDNLVNIGNGVREEGIMSSNPVKSAACRWLRDILRTPEVSIELYDKGLIAEMEYFERAETGRYEKYAATGTKHDDFMMAFVWAMYSLTEETIEYLFDVQGRFETMYKVTLHEKIANWTESNVNQMQHDGDDDLSMFNKRIDNLDATYNALKKGNGALAESKTNENLEEESYSFAVTGDEDDFDSFFK